MPTTHEKNEVLEKGKVTENKALKKDKADNHENNQVQGKNLEVGNKALLPYILVRKFSAIEIIEATGNFSQLSILGKGGFGTVYSGYLKGTKVAIKRFTEVWFGKQYVHLSTYICFIQNAAVRFSQAENVTVPHKFTLHGQLNCELWALTRYTHDLYK